MKPIKIKTEQNRKVEQVQQRHAQQQKMKKKSGRVSKGTGISVEVQTFLHSEDLQEN